MITVMLEIFLSGMLILFVWFLAEKIKHRFKVIEKYFIPSALIAGIIGLVAIIVLPKSEAILAVREIWSSIPVMLINVVFACLFLGKKILGFRETWLLAGPQVVFGQTLAWGQYVVGLLLALLVLVPVFNLSPLSGALIEISFEGGHGTAAGLRPVFEDLGFADGADLAIGLATVGIVVGVMSGVLLVNWAHRTKRINMIKLSKKEVVALQRKDIIMLDDEAHEPSPHWLRRRRVLSLLAHAGYIAVAIAMGRVLLDVLIYTENLLWAADGGIQVMKYIPLFPLAMIGGVLVQYILHKLKATILIDRDIINKIGSISLDILIIAAVATISLSVLGEYFIPFVFIALTGTAWNLFGIIVIAPRVIPSYWFERGIGDYGQSMGMTATGLLLMKIADPSNESQALESFGYKQLFFEPIVGGGIFTATSMVLIFQFGAFPMLVFTALIMAGWLLFGRFYFGRMERDSSKAHKPV
jgi:glutamate:Na+ symporter, ESS family